MNEAAQWAIDNEKYLKKLIRKTASIVNEEDVYQDLMVRLLVSGKKIIKPRQGVTSSAVFAARNAVRKMKSRLGMNSVELVDLTTNVTPEKQLIHNSVINSVEQAIENLGETAGKQRNSNRPKEIIKMVLSSDKTMADLARENGINANTFKAHYRLGIMELRNTLDLTGLIEENVEVIISENEDENRR